MLYTSSKTQKIKTKTSRKKKKKSGTTLNDRVKTCMVPNTLRLAVKGYLIHANFLIPLLLNIVINSLNTYLTSFKLY